MNKKTLLALILTAVLAASIGYMANPIIQHMDPKVNVYMEICKGEANGATATLWSGNLITDIGENFTGNCTLGLSNNGTWAIALSNDGSPTAGLTELSGEVAANGFTRAAADITVWSNSGDWAFNATHTFMASGTQQLQTAALHWDDTSQSDNNMLAAADFTQTTFEASDTLTVTWIITFNAN